MCYLYSGISIKDLYQLNIYEYRIILINALYDRMIQSEEGKQMLNDFYYINNNGTEFDSEALMALFPGCSA